MHCLKVKRSFIAHVDMDAFFASVETRDKPSLHLKPVIVGSDPKGGRGRGVVSACSYEARSFGIHSAMPISVAYRKCPHGVFIPVDMEKYSAASREIYEILHTFTPDIEPVGIDEAFLDITGSYHLFGTPLETCRLIKSKIKDLTGLTASIGLAPSKIAAKIASDLGKPDGLLEVPEGGLAEFLCPLEVQRLWGLGPKAEKALEAIGIKTIGELARRPIEHIRGAIGSQATDFWKIANGIDESELTIGREAKSISNEITFDSDTADRDVVFGALMDLSEKVAGRLRESALWAKTITLKIRLSGFKTYTRSVTASKPTNITNFLYNATKELYNEFKEQKIRLVGVRASSFSSGEVEKDLFTHAADRKLEDIESSVDKIRIKFGNNAIYRASIKKIKRTI
ncbi:MAG: DNA polymerase IV [Candidatus Omnitrophica bacterium]|nr:DNA polymerase IV [Candidatus Omnitrophota bacterium]